MINQKNYYTYVFPHRSEAQLPENVSSITPEDMPMLERGRAGYYCLRANFCCAGST
jgi:hypothetical protein